MNCRQFARKLTSRCLYVIKRNLRGRPNLEIRETAAFDQEVEIKNSKTETHLENFNEQKETEIEITPDNIVPQPYFLKAKQYEGVTEENKISKLKATVTPLWKVPYEQQLYVKYKNCQKILKSLAQELQQNNIFVQRDKSGLPCPLEYPLASPVQQNYRNKDEFSVRFGVDQITKTVGFFVSCDENDKKFVCVEGDELNNLKKEHLQVAKLWQQYIADSPYGVCTSFKKGYWRRLIVRSNAEGQLMVVIIMHPQSLSEVELEMEKNKIRDYFTIGAGKICQVSSLYFQTCEHSRCTNQQSPFQLLFGQDHLIETVGEIKLRVSPETFIQVNTEAARVLYDIILAYSAVKKDTTLLDICCGAGAIGLTLANHVCRTIGIEISAQSIEDALFNAQLNGVHNASFFRGKAERLVPQLAPELLCSDLVAIINPGRSGLESSVIRALRESKHLRRLLYIACKPEGKAKDNFIELCRPAQKNYRLGKPFFPVHAIPVDMFPQTYHCELVMVFERL